MQPASRCTLRIVFFLLAVGRTYPCCYPCLAVSSRGPLPLTARQLSSTLIDLFLVCAVTLLCLLGGVDLNETEQQRASERTSEQRR